jgi:hypothetical protein
MPALYLLKAGDRIAAIPAAGAHDPGNREFRVVAFPDRVLRPGEAKNGIAVTHSTAVSDPQPNANVRASDQVIDYD